MDQEDINNQQLSQAFSGMGGEKTTIESDTYVEDQFEETIQYYAVLAQDASPKRFKLILRSSETVSVPYSLLPIIILVDSNQIYIKSYELLISIKGRNLESLENALSEEKVNWIRESLSGKDTGHAEVYVESITIQGKAVEKYVEP